MLGHIFAFDISLERAIDTARNPFLVHCFELLTHLGDARIITVVAISLLIIFFRHRRFAYKAGLLLSIFGTLAFSQLVKDAIARPRPPAPFAVYTEIGYSFPSMHAAVSLATYGFAICAIWTLLRPPHHRTPAVSLLTILILLIGFSRIYLGVHYSSDVLGGYVVGGAFLWMGMWLTRVLSARDRVASKAVPFARAVRSRLVGNKRRAESRQPRA